MKETLEKWCGILVRQTEPTHIAELQEATCDEAKTFMLIATEVDRRVQNIFSEVITPIEDEKIVDIIHEVMGNELEWDLKKIAYANDCLMARHPQHADAIAAAMSRMSLVFKKKVTELDLGKAYVSYMRTISRVFGNETMGWVPSLLEEIGEMRFRAHACLTMINHPVLGKHAAFQYLAEEEIEVQDEIQDDTYATPPNETL